MLSLALVGCAMAAAWVVAMDANDDAAYRGALHARLETGARGLAASIDGDLLASGTLPAETTDEIRQVARALGFERNFQVLRTPPALLKRFAEQPDEPTRGNLEVILAGDGRDTEGEEFACTPEWGPLFRQQISTGELTTLLVENSESNAGVVAYAPITDAWGQSVGMLRLATTESGRTLWKHALSLTLWALVAGAGLGLALFCANSALRRHCASLTALTHGYVEEALGAFPSKEMRALTASLTPGAWSGSESEDENQAHPVDDQERDTGAQQLEPAAALPRRSLDTTLRAAAIQRIGGAPGAQPRAAAMDDAGVRPGAERESAAGAVATHISTEAFSPRELAHEAVAAIHGRASRHALELRITIGDRVPEVIQSQQAAIRRALGQLLEQAVSTSRSGVLQVRMSRLAESCMLRVEVIDNGTGIPWEEQADLRDELNHARLHHSDDSEGGLACAAALAAELGGKLEFESQPGSGSRFWFTAAYLAN